MKALMTIALAVKVVGLVLEALILAIESGLLRRERQSRSVLKGNYSCRP